MPRIHRATGTSCPGNAARTVALAPPPCIRRCNSSKSRGEIPIAPTEYRGHHPLRQPFHQPSPRQSAHR